MASEELRERLIQGMHAEYKRQFDKPMFPPYAETAVDAVLQEIEAAGYVLVPKEQIEKLWRAVVAQEERERGEG
jgi:hypothetical protein